MFPDILMSLRKSRSMTQKQVAEALGIGQSTYALYEIGKRLPDMHTIIKIADYFGVACDYLLGRSLEPHPVKTYADIIRFLTPLMDAGILRFDETASKEPCLRTRSKYLQHFFERWKLMLDKRDMLSFDDDLYSAWLEKQIRETDKEIPEKLNGRDPDCNDPFFFQ